jgi:hypothetical protein
VYLRDVVTAPLRHGECGRLAAPQFSQACELGQRRVGFMDAVDFADLYRKELSYFAGD